MNLRSTDAYMTPEDTVRTANELAYRFSPDAPLRALAASIVGNVQDVRSEAPVRIAAWVRANIRYFQESPGIENLQGPYTTLPPSASVGGFQFEGTGVGDCDDLAILFATLCRAVGLHGYVAAISPHPYDGRGFVHALGYCRDNRKFYELSRDETYGGIPGKPLEFSAPPVGMSATYFCPLDGQFVRVVNDPENPLPSYTNTVPATPRRNMGDTKNPDTSGGFIGKSPVANSSNSPATRNSGRMREAVGEVVEQATPVLREVGIDPSAYFNANPNSTGQGGVIPMAMAGLQYGAQEAGDTSAGGRVLGTAASVIPAAAASGNPVAIAAASVIVAVAVIKEALRARRANQQQEELGRKIIRKTDEIVDLSLGTISTRERACRALLMKYRMYECAAIFADTYGAKPSGYRDRVKVAYYRDVMQRVSDRSNDDVGLSALKNYGFGGTPDRLFCESNGAAFFDGTTWAKGMNYVGGTNLTSPVRLLSDQYDAVRLTFELVQAVGRASGFRDNPLQELHLSMFWSLLAQVIPMGLTSVVQSTAGAKKMDGRVVQQAAVPISFDVFWRGLQPTFQQAPGDICTPAALAFGATPDEFSRGEIGRYLTAAGMRNYKVFEEALEEAQQWDFGPPAPRRSGGGGLIAAAALAAGAYVVSRGGG